ncbi:GNAT family N-acetyltransferase [uncultured Vibrio sp.]|uniref:GNAT family N-acetyltransferase n=1 Tax=uncultured Vibrio sp. TaxID=114054 RepID=UPI00091C79F5|nr:GNAT family N-acetyltransferase [uncultured Vibrio sp.]OIQ24982.1 MAG: GNAT family N-acetyltransferase [Vibrio sp. MedPE-SWchi]
MSIRIQQGTLEQVKIVVDNIDEFTRKQSLESMQEKLEGRDHLILIALSGDQPIGFKIGYRLDSKTFYSWFGGVSPEGRKRGIAQSLLERQEQWAREQAYQAIKVKSQNRYPSMLRLLIFNGYLVEKTCESDDIDKLKIEFVKAL